MILNPALSPISTTNGQPLLQLVTPGKNSPQIVVNLPLISLIPVRIIFIVPKMVEVGHTAKECPRSRKAARKQPVRTQTGNSKNKKPTQQSGVPPSTSQESPASSKPPADLRDKINKARASEEARKVLPPPAPGPVEVKVAFEKSPRDLRDKLIARRNATPLAPSTQAFDLDLSVRLAKSTPSSSQMVTDFSHKVTQKPGKQLEVVVSNPVPAARKQGKSRHVSSSNEESDDSLAEVAVTPKPRSKRVKRFEQSQKSPGHKADRRSSNTTDVASSGQTNNVVEDCLDGSNIIEIRSKTEGVVYP